MEHEHLLDWYITYILSDFLASKIGGAATNISFSKLEYL